MAFYKYDPRSKYTREKKTSENRQAYIDALKRDYEAEQSINKESIKDEISRKNKTSKVMKQKPAKKDHNPYNLHVGQRVITRLGIKGTIEKWSDKYVYIRLNGKLYKGELHWIGKSIFLD